MSNQSPDLRPRTIRHAIEGMIFSLDAEQAGDLAAIIQFKVTGENPVDYHLTISDGKCSFAEGAAEQPSLTIETPADVWLKIARKEMNGATALMTGKYKARGQLGLLMKMDTLFSRQPTEAELAEKGWI